MRAEMYGRNVRLSPAARAHVERRVRFALGRLATRVGRVRVGFAKPAGRRGAARQCRVIVDLLRAGRVVVEHRAARWGEAVAGAVWRMAAAVRRQLGRRRARQRRPRAFPRKEVTCAALPVTTNSGRPFAWGSSWPAATRVTASGCATAR